MKLGLRSAATALGLLVVVVVTATAASAQSADLSITQLSSPDPVAAGGKVTATITVTNNGPDAATNVALVNLFPPNSNLSANAIPGWTCEFAGITIYFQCTIPSLAAGTSTIFNASYTSSNQTPSGEVLINTPIITSTTLDPNPSNNVASVATTVSPGGTPMAPTDVAVTKTGAATAQRGQNIPYTITVTNNGPQAAGGINIGEATPPDTTFVSLVAPPGWDCTAPPVGGVGLVACTLPSPPGPLGVGATATFTLTVQVQGGTPLGTSVFNIAHVASGIDPSLTNNRAIVHTLIQNSTATPTATVTATATATSTTTPTATFTPLPGAATVTPTATPTCILGDINCDGIVDIRDYGLWRASFGQQGAGNRADLNGDGIVDIRDYGIWRQHFGEGTPADRRGNGPGPVGMGPAPRGTPGPAPLAGDQTGARSGPLLQAAGSEGAIPVIPLVGGLLGLGGLAGWRARRPRDSG
jgi:uncharacterized repeat protein (TIGR01451 family)